MCHFFSFLSLQQLNLSTIAFWSYSEATVVRIVKSCLRNINDNCWSVMVTANDEDSLFSFVAIES